MWWRIYLTQLQIIQFIVDCLVSILWIYFYWQRIPCKGSLTVWIIANLVGLSFLYLFIQFYQQQYSSKLHSQ